MKKLARRSFIVQTTSIIFAGCLPKVKKMDIRNRTKVSYLPTGKNDNSLRGLQVALTVGHGCYSSGGFDHGATRGSLDEFSLNFTQADTIARRLASYGARVELFVYKDSALGADLDERGLMVGESDIHISIHHNSYTDPKVQGGEVLVCRSTATDEDKILAGSICENMNKNTGLKNRGVKQSGLAVLKATPAKTVKCLTEPLFLSARDYSEYQLVMLSEKAGFGIADGVKEYWLARSGVNLQLYSSGKEKHDSRSLRVVPEVGMNDLPGLYDDH